MATHGEGSKRIVFFISGVLVLGTVIYGVLVLRNVSRNEKVPVHGTVSKDEKIPTVSKMQLLQAVEKAKKENRQELSAIIRGLVTGKIAVPDGLLLDFAAFLKEKDPQAQLLGAVGMYTIKNQESKGPLREYLQSKDFEMLERQVYEGQLPERQYEWQLRASGIALLVLGELKDKSSIPLIESLRQVSDLKYEFGGGPVHEALVRIGPEGIRILSKIRSGDSLRDQMRTESAIRHVKDPACIVALIEIVENPECPGSIRGAAISALSEMDNSKETMPFLISVMQSSEYSQYLRDVAAKAIGTTNLPDARDALRKELENPDSTVSNACLLSLAANDPQKYLPEVMEWVMNTSLPMKDRKQLALGLFHMDAQILAGHNEQITSGLTATDENKHPADEVRIYIWKTLNKSTGQEPPLEVGDENIAYQKLYGDIDQKTIRENVHASVAEVKEMVDTRIKSIIIKWQPEKGDL